MLYSSGDKDYVLKGLEEALASIIKIKQTVEQLPDLPTWAELWVTDRSLYINVPFDWEKYQSIRRMLGCDFDSLGTHSDDDGDMWRNLCHKTGINLDIILKPRLEGSTCQLVQIGEKTTPVFETRC